MTFLKKIKFEILIILFVIFCRIPFLGHDTFNTDVWKWKARSYDFSTGIFTGDFVKTLQKYHPGVTLMWCGTAAIKIANFISENNTSLSVTDNLFILHSIQKFFVVLTIAVTLGFAFYAIRNLLGLDYAILILLFISLEPFFMALSREFHLEGLLSTFMLTSVLWLYLYFTDTKNKKRLYIAAFFAGLSILTKSSGIFVLLFSGLQLLINLYQNRDFKKELSWFVTFAFITISTFFLFWPALWVSPAHVLNELFRGVSEIGVDTDHIQYYFGKLVGNPGPSYYFVVFALRSSIWLFIGSIGYIFVYRNLTKDQKKLSNYIMLYIIFYLIQITLPSKKLDRYILPGFIALTIPATFFWIHFINKFKMSRQLFFSTFFGFLIITNLLLLPDFLSYYNPLFGGLRTGIRVLEPKWLIGQKELLKYFGSIRLHHGYEYSGNDDSFEEIIYRNPKKNVLSVGFQEKYYTQVWPFFREIGAWAVIQDLTPFAVQTKYFVYPVWDDRAPEENRFKISYVADIKIRGESVYKVYERIE